MGEVANTEESKLKSPDGTIINSNGLDPDFPDLSSRTPLTDGTPADFLDPKNTITKTARPKGTNVDVSASESAPSTKGNIVDVKA